MQKKCLEEELPTQALIQSYPLTNFELLSKRVFEEKKGVIFIGGEEIRPDIKSILKEQANYLKTSQFYDILKSTIINESSNIALMQSKNFDEVTAGKMLFHWQYVLDNMIRSLTK